MNKQIYSLVAIYFYILLIATIQCFTNNENLNKYVRKNENVHDEYEINGLYINNNGKFRYRSLSEHSTEDKEETVTISDNKSSKTKGDMHHSSIYDMATDDDNKPQKSKKSKFSSMFKRDKKDKDSDKTQETLDDDKSQETLDDDKSQETLDDDKSQETLDDDNK
ncbi:fam-c protein, partial [Plasmodium berghei]